MGTTMRSSTLSREQDALTGRIIGAAIEVHKALGPGLLEAIYHSAMAVELERVGLQFDREFPCSVFFHDRPVGEQRLDLVVAREVVVELKALESLALVHKAQLRTYLRASGLPIGLLINFGAELIQVRRVLNTPIGTSPFPRPIELPSRGR